MSGNSWVTLATNDSYALGALVLAHSLKRVGTIHNLTVMITPGVTASMRNQLASVFNVVEVNILDSKDEKNLALLTRPELGITFTKLHCWRLTQFSKCVFLDADVLVLQNCDELFDREELSAAADVGWPDCFNSGVFVYRPCIETYNALVNFALSQGSFDGGDQGLLNQFFSDWATKDISRHLPFIYNMCSSATYSYLPAFKQYGKNVKIVHFIGSAKPWLQYLDSETRQVKPSSGSEHLVALLQLWWDIFCHDVHSKLSSEMVHRSSQVIQLENSPMSNIIREICLNLEQQPFLHQPEPILSIYSQNPSYEYWDPWESYQEPHMLWDSKRSENSIQSNENFYGKSGSIVLHKSEKSVVKHNEGPQNNFPLTSFHEDHVFYDQKQSTQKAQDHSSHQTTSSYTFQQCVPTLQHQESHHYVHNSNYHEQQGLELYENRNVLHVENDQYQKNQSEVTEHENTNAGNYDNNYSSNFSLYSTDIHKSDQMGHGHISLQSREDIGISVRNETAAEVEKNSTDKLQLNSIMNVTNEHERAVLSHPASFSNSKTFISPDNHTISSSYDTECLPSSATTELSSEDAGLAGALSQLTLGVARTAEQIALEEHLRKQAWEHGNVDYMGRDSFDNIWRKICQTLAEAPSADSSSEQSKPSPQVSSVVTQTVLQGDADDTPPLPESVSLSSESKESSDTGTDAESLLKKPDVTEEYSIDTAAPTSNLTTSLTSTSSAITATATTASSISELSQVPFVPSDNKIATESEFIPVPSDLIEASTPSALISPQSEDVSCDPELKETVACETTGSDSKSSHENENQEAFPNIVIPLQESSQVASELKFDQDSQEKTKEKDIVLPIEIESTVVLPTATPHSTTLLATTTVATETTTITTTSIPKVSEISSFPLVMEKDRESIEMQIPALGPPEPEDVPCDSQLKETTCKTTGTDNEISLENENLEISQNIVIPQQEDSQISNELNLELQHKPEGKVTELSVETAQKKVTMKGNNTSLELGQSSTESSFVQDTVTSAPSELLKQSSDERAEPTEADSKIFSLPVEESATSSDADVQSGKILADTRTPLSETTSQIDTAPSDPKLVADLVSQSLGSQSDKISTSDTVADEQKVTVIEPTPPTSPLDSSATAPPALHSADTLNVQPSIPDTPPVGSDVLSADVTPSTTSFQSSASVTSPVVEGQVSADPRTQSVDPKAPIPPKRRHKQSQNPDQSSGSKPGKSSTKSSKGKK